MRARTFSTLSSVCAIALVSLCGSAALAGEAAAAPAAAASTDVESAFDRGVKALEAGDAAAAKEAFSVAWREQQTYDIASNLGVAELMLGEPAAAAGHFDYALAHLPPSASVATKEGLQRNFAKAKSEVGTLVVHIGVPDARVRVDGSEIGTAPLPGPIYVKPGSHEISVYKDGYAEVTHSETLAAGEEKAVTYDLAPLKIEEATSSKPSVAVIGTGLGVGLLGLGVGVGFTIAANGASADRDDALRSIGGGSAGLKDRCGAGTPFVAECAAISDASATRNSNTVGAIVAYTVGGAALVGTAIYALVTSSQSNASKATGLLILPTMGPTSGGILWTQSF